MRENKSPLLRLFFPIFLELLFTMLTGVVDTLMLSSVGDHAVGAVGTANSYINVFLVMFTIISSGMLAVMTQYIGADRPDVAGQTLRLGLLVNLAVGLLVTLLLCLYAEPILSAVGIARDLKEPAMIYMQTVGLFSVCSALIPIFSSYLRAFGHTASTLAATVAANITNVILNAFFLFVLDMGVWGIALATGISRLLNLVWVWLDSRYRIKPAPTGRRLKNRELLKKILQVGLPGAMESSLYNLAMMLVISFLNRMDSTGTQAIARSYAAQISNFSFCAGCALSQANAIIAGWQIGAGELEECDRNTRRNASIGMFLGGFTAVCFALFARPILSIFTRDSQIIELVCRLLRVDVALEMGRAFNMVYGLALKSSGDATYPMVIAIVFMFLFAVGGTWFFGISLGLMAVGAYVGMALDECVRGLFMYLRWRRGIWKSKNLLSDSCV